MQVILLNTFYQKCLNILIQLFLLKLFNPPFHVHPTQLSQSFITSLNHTSFVSSHLFYRKLTSSLSTNSDHITYMNLGYKQVCAINTKLNNLNQVIRELHSSQDQAVRTLKSRQNSLLGVSILGSWIKKGLYQSSSWICYLTYLSLGFIHTEVTNIPINEILGGIDWIQSYKPNFLAFICPN